MIRAGGARSHAATVAAPAPTVGARRFDEDFLRRLEALAIVAKKARGGTARAERRSRRVGAGIELGDHRDYAPGDDVRALDWNLYARLDRPFVRLRQEDEDLTITVVVDASASMALGRPPKLEVALRIAAALAYIGLSSLDRVGVAIVAAGVREALGPLRGRGAAARLLALLERTTAGGATDLAAAVRQALATQGPRRGRLAVLISDVFDPAGLRPALDLLRAARVETIVVPVTAPDEAAGALAVAAGGGDGGDGDLDAAGGDTEIVIVDAETGERRDVTLTPAVARAYVERYLARQRTIASLCRERGVACLPVSSDVSFEDAVLRILRTSGVLA